MPRWTIVDDGTLDTVVQCNTCQRVYRFTPVDVEDASEPEVWMRQCVESAHMAHEYEAEDCKDR